MEQSNQLFITKKGLNFLTSIRKAYNKETPKALIPKIANKKIINKSYDDRLTIVNKITTKNKERNINKLKNITDLNKKILTNYYKKKTKRDKKLLSFKHQTKNLTNINNIITNCDNILTNNNNKRNNSKIVTKYLNIEDNYARRMVKNKSKKFNLFIKSTLIRT